MLGRIILIAAAAAGGWAVGSVYPAPQAWIERINPQVIDARVRALSDRAITTAEAAGQVISVEHSGTGDSSDGADMATATAAIPAQGSFGATLSECPGMTVSNGPRVDKALKVANFAPVVDVNGVRLAVAPVSTSACLSSGFGQRGSRLHKGLDYHADVGGPIMAAAEGTVIEMKYRDDYGNMILIDHGHGVYTRYAHLSNFGKDLKVGGHVKAGDVIGLMGNTASYPIPIHLHYEVLTGDYNNPKASFGLTPVNPFGYHAA